MRKPAYLIGAIASTLALSMMIARGGAGGGGGDFGSVGDAEGAIAPRPQSSIPQATPQPTPKSELRLLNDETLRAYRQYLDRAVNQQVLSSVEESKATGKDQIQIIWERQRKVVSGLDWELKNGAGEKSEEVRRSLILQLHILQLAEAVISNRLPLKFPDANQQGNEVVQQMLERLERLGIDGKRETESGAAAG